MDKLCRICLTDNNLIASLKSAVEVFNENQMKCELNILEGKHETDNFTILNLIQLIMGADQNEENDFYPKYICTECVDLLGYAYKFYMRYLKSTKYLQTCEEKNVIHPNDDHNYSTKRPIINYKKQQQQDPKEEILTIVYDYESEAVQKHSCPICLKMFNALELRQHAKTHKSLKSYIQAVNLDKKYKFTVDMNQHSIELNTKNKHKCPYCMEMVESNDYKKHIINHKSNNIKTDKLLKCRFCSRGFKMFNHLKMHENCHRKEYPYNCSTCGKKFVQKNNYECHLLSHDPNAEMKYKCNECEAKFYNPIHLRRHKIIHTENRTYNEKFAGRKCSKCLITFRENFDNHNCITVDKLKRPKTIKKPLKRLCTVCGQQVRNMQTHLLSHSDVRPFKCDFCGKTFRYKVLLNRHKLIHTGQKPFVCSWCGKCFNSRANMQTHERIHIGNKCHVCDICGKGFLEKAYLRKHKMIHQNIPIKIELYKL